MKYNTRCVSFLCDHCITLFYTKFKSIAPFVACILLISAIFDVRGPRGWFSGEHIRL